MNNFFRNFITSGMATFPDKEIERNVFFVNIFSIVGLLPLVIFGLVNVLQGDTIISVVELGLGVIVILNLIMMRIFALRWRIPALIVMMVIVIILLLVLFFHGGIGGTGIYWSFTVPVISFFLWNKKVGTRWVAGILLLFGTIAFFSSKGLFDVYYGPVEMRQFFIAFIVLSGIVYVFRSVAEQQQRDLTSKEDSLRAVSAELKAALEKARRSEAALKKNADDLEREKRNLEDSRRATLNLLEDIGESKAKSDAILKSLGDGLVVTDREGTIQIINEMCVDLLGYTLDDVRGEKLASVVQMYDENDESILDEDRLITKAMQAKATVQAQGVIKYEKKDGTRFPVSIVISPIALNESITGVVAVFRDITKEYEIDKAKTEFVSLASHQLRTPLSVINWYSELLLSGDAGEISDSQRDYLQEIAGGNRRMVELVDALLNVSRIELGTFAVDPEPTDIIALARGVMDELKIKIDDKNQMFVPNLSGDIPIMNIDPKLTRMIFENLLTNAVKYTPNEGKIIMSVSLNQNRDTVIVELSDTGYGIPANQQDKIFGKLFRADNVKQMDTEGTGLGLYLVKSIVEHTGGHVRFESPYVVETDHGKEEVQGTKFVIELPLSGMIKKKGTRTLS